MGRTNSMAEAAEINIVIKATDAREWKFSFPASATFLDIKEKLNKKEGIGPELQRLVYRGDQKNDDMTLEGEEVEEGDTIFLILTLTWRIKLRWTPVGSASVLTWCHCGMAL